MELRSVITFIFLSLSYWSVADTATTPDVFIDSLQQVIQTAEHDSIVFEAKLEWWRNIYRSNPDESLVLLEEIAEKCTAGLTNKTELTTEQNRIYLKYLEKAHYHSGDTFLHQDLFEKAIAAYETSLQLSLEFGDPEMHVNNTANIGNKYLFRNEKAEAVVYFEQALQLSEASGDSILHASTLDKIGMFYLTNGIYKTAMNYFQTSYTLSEKIDFKFGIDHASHHLGVCYGFQGNHKKALQHFFISWKICEELGNKRDAAVSLNTIGLSHMQLGNHDAALDYFEKAQKISQEEGDQHELSYNQGHFGYVYFTKGAYQQALVFFEKGLKIAETNNYENLIIRNLKFIADTHLALGNIDQALVGYQKNFEISRKMNFKIDEVSSLLDLGASFIQKNEFEKAYQYVHEAHQMATDLSLTYELKEATFSLYKIYNNREAFQLALQMYEEYVVLDDSIQKNVSQKEFYTQEFEYQYEKKSIADSLESLQTQQLMQNEFQAQKQRFNILKGSFGIIALFVTLLIYLYRQLNKANHTTKKQAVTIHQANEELSAALEHQTMLQGEIHHRVKNNLQVIISLLALQKEDIKDQQAKESLDAMSNRIFSIAAIHEILYPKEGVTKINFSEYTERICHYFGDFNALEDRPNFNIKVKDFEFNIDTGMPLGVILTELITNSLKHARKETEQLFISIELQKLDKWFALTYRDNGLGFPAEKLKDREGGLGAYLLRSMARQLRGQIKTKNNNGAVSVIYFMEK